MQGSPADLKGEAGDGPVMVNEDIYELGESGVGSGGSGRGHGGDGLEVKLLEGAEGRQCGDEGLKGDFLAQDQISQMEGSGGGGIIIIIWTAPLPLLAAAALLGLLLLLLATHTRQTG